MCVGHPPAGNGRPDRADGPGRADEERAPRDQVSLAIVPDGIALWVIMAPRAAPSAGEPGGIACRMAANSRHPGRSSQEPALMKQLHNVR